MTSTILSISRYIKLVLMFLQSRLTSAFSDNMPIWLHIKLSNGGQHESAQGKLYQLEVDRHVRPSRWPEIAMMVAPGSCALGYIPMFYLA